jgi:hypothetical protein
MKQNSFLISCVSFCFMRFFLLTFLSNEKDWF